MKKTKSPKKKKKLTIVRDGTCLLIRHKGHHFFSHKTHAPYLVEMAKAIGAELSFVKVREAKLLTLATLCDAINSGQHMDSIVFEPAAGEAAISPPVALPQKDKLASVKQYIREQFLRGRVVSVKSLAKDLAKYELSNSSINYHLGVVKDNMRAEGYVFNQDNRGEHRI